MISSLLLQEIDYKEMFSYLEIDNDLLAWANQRKFLDKHEPRITNASELNEWWLKELEMVCTRSESMWNQHIQKLVDEKDCYELYNTARRCKKSVDWRSSWMMDTKRVKEDLINKIFELKKTNDIRALEKRNDLFTEEMNKKYQDEQDRDYLSLGENLFVIANDMHDFDAIIEDILCLHNHSIMFQFSSFDINRITGHFEVNETTVEWISCFMRECTAERSVIDEKEKQKLFDKAMDTFVDYAAGCKFWRAEHLFELFKEKNYKTLVSYAMDCKQFVQDFKSSESSSQKLRDIGDEFMKQVMIRYSSVEYDRDYEAQPSVWESDRYLYDYEQSTTEIERLIWNVSMALSEQDSSMCRLDACIDSLNILLRAEEGDGCDDAESPEIIFFSSSDEKSDEDIDDHDLAGSSSSCPWVIDDIEHVDKKRKVTFSDVVDEKFIEPINHCSLP